MPSRWYPRLRTRIVVWFIGVLLFIGSFLVVSIHYFVLSELKSSLKKRGMEMIESLSLQAKDLILVDDVHSLHSLTGVARRKCDVAYVFMVNSSGTVLSHTFPRGVPGALLGLHPDGPSPMTKITLIRVRPSSELIYDFEKKEPFGAFRLGLSLAAIQETSHQVLSYTILVTMATVLVIFAVALRVSQPVEQLTRAVERAIDNGVVGEKRFISDTYETYQLCERFNQVMRELRTKIRDLEQSREHLERSKKMAYLGGLAASVAHEVNNPLGVVLLKSELLSSDAREDGLTDRYCRELDRIKQHAMRAGKIIQGLLLFSRHAAGGAEIRREQFDLNELVRETLTLFGERIKAWGGEVQLNLHSTPPLNADRNAIQQVIINLADNALDAMTDGGQLTITTAEVEKRFCASSASPEGPPHNSDLSGSPADPARQSEPKATTRTTGGECVALTIEDTGSGMPPDVLESCLEPFFTTKVEGKGTGLGLSISYGYISDHGGEFRIESEPDRGTKVIVRIPCNGERESSLE